MSRGRAIGLAVVALFVGLIAGGWIAESLRTRWVVDYAAVTAAADANLTLYSLYRLRNNDPAKATENLESKLDDATLVLATRLHDVPKSRRDPSCLRVIARVKTYRSKYPRAVASPIDRLLAKALSDLE